MLLRRFCHDREGAVRIDERLNSIQLQTGEHPPRSPQPYGRKVNATSALNARGQMPSWLHLVRKVLALRHKGMVVVTLF